MSQNKKKVAVRIVNPVGDCEYTSEARAERYIRRGMAHFVIRDGKRCLEVLPMNARAARAVKAATISAQRAYDRECSSGLAPLEAVSNLPMVLAPKAYIDRSNTPRRESRGRTGKARVVARDGMRC